MKRIFAITLCLLSLCACRSIALPEETTTATPPVEIKTSEGDPYFCVLKAYAQVDEDFLYALYEPNPPSEEAFALGFLAQPEGVFTNLKNGMDVGTKLCYALYDIDGNGTNELLLGGAGGPFPAAGLLEIYAIQDGVAVQQPLPLNWCGDCLYSCPSLRKDGTIQSEYDSWNNEDSSYSYYRFEDGQLKLKMKLILKKTGLLRYFRNNASNPISWKKFERLRKEYNRAWQEAELAEIDWKPLTEYNQTR